MSTLSDQEVLDGIKDRTILIEPFNPDQLQNCSYDVRLGSNFYVETSGSDPWGKVCNQGVEYPPVLNIWSKNQVENVYQPGKILSKEDIINSIQMRSLRNFLMMLRLFFCFRERQSSDILRNSLEELKE